MPTFAREDLLGMAGWESEPSAWLRIDQDRIDRFAEATGDRQFIHVDPERAAQTPFGTTIAHGFLSLSLVSYLSREIAAVPRGVVMAINYGLERVRFLRPVPVGSEVRLRTKLLEVRERDGDRLLVRSEATLEAREGRRPALVAETLALYVLAAEQEGGP